MKSGLNVTKPLTVTLPHIHIVLYMNFINLHFLFSVKGLDHIAENILSYVDAESLRSAEIVCKEWNRVICEGMLWKKLIERKVRTDSLWRGLAERRGWIQYLFKPKPGQQHRPHTFYRDLFPKIMNVSFSFFSFFFLSF